MYTLPIYYFGNFLKNYNNKFNINEIEKAHKKNKKKSKRHKIKNRKRYI